MQTKASKERLKEVVNFVKAGCLRYDKLYASPLSGGCTKVLEEDIMEETMN